MRPFGRVVDLDVDFALANRPDLVTTLLVHCSEDSDAGFWWSQPVGERTAALLRLVALTEHRNDITLTARCTADGCGELFKFSLPLDELSNSSVDAAPLHVLVDGDRHLTMRRPTGDDLRAWRAARPASHDDALRLVLRAER